jgi:MFS superfamily sulfate permease-like transporter
MSTKRFIGTVAAVFLISQIFAIIIHGFILGSDYQPFYGTLLRPMQADAPKWMGLFLPLAHLAMAIAFVALFGRWVRSGPEIPQGLRFGVLAWLMGPVPMYLLWFAEQPWPLSLTLKQLLLDLFAMLVLGTLTSMLYKPAPADSHQL